jgi:hypothetical protein
MPIPLLAAAAVAPSVFQMGKGIAQASQAKRLKVPPRPVYNIPQSIQENVMMRRMQQNAAMPGYNAAKADISSNMASGARAAQESGSSTNVLATIAGLQGNANNALNSLNTQNAQFALGAKDDLSRALSQKAGFEEKAWEINKQQPFLDAAAAKAALKESSSQNLMGGLSGLASTAATFAGSGAGAGGAMSDAYANTLTSTPSRVTPNLGNFNEQIMADYRKMNPLQHQSFSSPTSQKGRIPVMPTIPQKYR